MRDDHIISMLEKGPLGGLSESELAAIESHAEVCARCGQAYRAAQVSTLLLAERAAQRVDPPLFFQTRVLAAIRQTKPGAEMSALERLWRTSSWLLSSMAALVVLLAAVSLFTPTSQPLNMTAGAGFGTVQEMGYEASELDFLLADAAAIPASEEMTYGQVLSTLYEAGGEDGGGNER